MSVVVAAGVEGAVVDDQRLDAPAGIAAIGPPLAAFVAVEPLAVLVQGRGVELAAEDGHADHLVGLAQPAAVGPLLPALETVDPPPGCQLGDLTRADPSAL